MKIELVIPIFDQNTGNGKNRRVGATATATTASSLRDVVTAEMSGATPSNAVAEANPGVGDP